MNLLHLTIGLKPGNKQPYDRLGYSDVADVKLWLTIGIALLYGISTSDLGS